MQTPKKRKGPRISQQFIRRLSTWLVLSTTLTLAVRSASLYWDGGDAVVAGNDPNTGAGLGGSGTWDNGSTAHWWDPLVPAEERAWNNANLDTAIFTGPNDSPKTVTLGSPVTAAAVTFNVDGYTIMNGGISANTLTLAGTAPVMTVVNAGHVAVVSSTLAGTAGFTLDGEGTLVLSGNNTITGGVRISSGVLQLGNRGALNAAAPNSVTFTPNSDGVLRLNGNHTTISGLDSESNSNAVVENGSAVAANLTVKKDFLTRSTFGGVVQDGAGGGKLSLIKSGNGTLALTNNANTFSGDVSIQQGQLVITHAGQLGTGTTAISVTGQAQTGNPGFSGGTLMLQGSSVSTSGAGITMGREVSVSGRGPTPVNNTGGLVSIGYNTLAGGLTIGTQATESRVWATHGTTTISGDVYLGAAAGNGAIFQGDGNWIISGLVSGEQFVTDRFIKVGHLISSTIWLQNAGNNFLQSIRIDNGTVRVSSSGALGLNNSTQAVDLNNGTLEIRTDTPNFASRHVQVRNNTTGTIFVDHAIGSNLLNQTVAFDNLLTPTNFGNNTNININGRNGYGVSFATATGGSDGSLIINNNSSGLFAINSNIIAVSQSTNVRSLTLQGNADNLLVGNFTPGGTAAHVLNKGGRGTLTIQGTASTHTGGTNVNDGTLAIHTFGGINATTGTLNLGNATTTSGILSYLGGIGTGAGETAIKPIRINTTTANSAIFANQSGTAPTALVLSGTFSALAGNKILYLGGANYQNGIQVQLDNEISAQIPDSGTLQLGKTGTGTWVLSNQNNLFNGTTSIYGGTLKMKATAGGTTSIIKTGGAITFGADTAANTGWTGTQTAAGTLQYDGFSSGAATTNTQGLGALTVSAGAATVVLNPGANNAITLSFASLVTPAAGTGLNFVVPAGNTVQIAGSAGFVDAHAYFNGADFAYSGAGSTLRAPIYDGDAGFVTASAALIAANHNLVSANTSTGELTISSLKISGNQTVDQTGLLTIQTAANSSGGVIMTGGSGVLAGTGVTTAGSGDLVIRVNGSGDTLTLSAPVTGTTSGGLTKNGAGTLNLTAANAYTGATTINEGTIVIGAGSRLGGASASNNNNLAVRQGATLDLGGNSIGVGAFNGAGVITNSGASSVLTIGNNNQNGTFSGIIRDGTGTMGVTKAGTGGSMALTGLNTYSGVTTLGAGTLMVTTLANIGVASGIGTGIGGLAASNAQNAASLVFAGGALQYTGANATIFQTTQTPSVSINRLFTLAGNGTIDSSGSYGANFLGRTANHAALMFNNTADVAFSGSGARNLTLTGDSIGDNMLAVRLTNNTNAGEALSLTKSGGSLWILNPSAANTYTGETLVNGGVLRAVDGMGLSAGSLLTLNGGQLETSGTFNRTLGAAASNVRLNGGNSGFAASTQDRLVVSLNNGGSPLAWGSNVNFSPGSLVLGSSTALGETEVTNDINLGTANRTVTVNNNSSTGTMVTAGILSGVISGGTGGSLTKAGGGVLMLGNANTYVGNTIITNGNVFVTSVGNATGTASSSLGASGGTLIYNPGNGDLNGLFYVGSGETASRAFIFTTSAQIDNNRTYRIDASGSGALVLNGAFANTVSANAAGRTTTLELRGASTDANQLNMVLTNSTGTNAPILALSKNDGGVWILNPAGTNSFTGSISSNGGLLGLTASGIGAASVINLNNGGIFAFGGALTTSVGVQGNNSTAVFAGQNNITINANVTKTAGNNQWTISNNLEGGALLRINGNFINQEAGTSAATQTISIRGFGSTEWNGSIGENAAAGGKTAWDIRIADGASFTMLGLANTYTGTTTLGQGTLILSKNSGQAQLGATSQFNFNGGALQAGLSLTGANKITTLVVLGGDQATVSGSNSIEFGGATALVNSGGNRFLRNELDPSSTLTISGQVNLSNDNTGRTLTVRGTGNTIISGVVANGGTAAGGLAYSGLNTLTLTNANTATGALTINRNTVVLSGANGAWNFGTVQLNPTGTLRLDNSLGDNPLGRLNNTGAFVGNGGRLDIIGDANGSTHTTGAFTVNSVQTYITMSGPGPNLINFASVNFANTGSSLNLTGIANLGTTNKVTFTGALGSNALINGVMPRTFIAGGNFATYDNVAGVKAFTNYNPGSTTNINLAAGPADTVEVNAAMTTTDLTTSRTINALKLNGTSLSVGGIGSTLTLSAAAVLNTGGNNSIDTAVLAFGGNTGYFQVNDLTTLEINSTLTGTSGLAKVLTGTLQINAPSFVTSTHNLMNGTTRLNGGLNTFYQGQLLNMNDGATLDLNGNTQYVGQLSDPGTLPESGGVLTSLSGTGTIVTNMAAGSTTFATSINGAVNFARVGGNTLTLESINTYNGATTLMGGNLVLQDDATILNTPTIDINYATLQLNNNSSLQRAIYDRVGDNTAITLRGGTLRFDGKVSDPATETFGALVSAQGANTVTVNTGGTGTSGAITSADVTFASLARQAATTVNFTGSNLGQQGNNSRIFFTTPVPTVGGGLLGAWAIANSSDYAAYNAGVGVGIVGQGGFVGYDGMFGTGKVTNVAAAAAMTTTLTNAVTTSALLRLVGAFNNDIAFSSGGNVLNLELGGILRSNENFNSTFGTTATRGVITAGGTENAGLRELIVYNAATGTTNFTGGSTVTGSATLTMANTAGLTAGMTITGNGVPAGTVIVSVDSPTQITVNQSATATASGTLTFAGGTTLVTVNSVIANNGSGNSVQVVKSGAGTMLLTANNTYTGGTVVNQGSVNLVGSGVILPAAGGLTINGGVGGTGAFVGLTGAGQIAATTDVTLNGRATLTFANGTANTLNTVVFNNNGGEGNPTINVGTGSTLTLSSSAPITATSSNAATTSTIAGGTLALAAGENVFNIAPIALGATTYSTIQPTLSVTSLISGSGSSILKTGDGLLQVSGTSTFSGGVNVQGGGIIVGADSTGSGLNAAVTAGPLGTGALTMADGTSLFVDNNNRTVANAVNFQGDIIFNNTGTAVTRTLTLNGPITVPTASTTIDVITPGLIAAFGGQVTGGGPAFSLTKTGLGTLVLSNVLNGGLSGTLNTSGSQAIVVKDGTLEIQGATGTNLEAMGVGPNAVVADNIIVDSGTLMFNPTATSSVLSANRGIMIGSATGSGIGYLGVATSGRIVTYTGAIADNGIGADALVKVGAGELRLLGNNTFTGDVTVAAGTLAINNSANINDREITLVGGTLSLLFDGDGTGSRQLVDFNSAVNVVANSTINVNRLGNGTSTGPLLFQQAANKTARFTGGPLTFGGGALTLTIASSNGYGVEFGDGVTLASGTTTFNVGGSSATNVVPGLILSGVVAGGSTAGSTVLTKSGGGTLLLSNAGNTFGAGGNQIISITGGILAASSDAALGHASNQVQLNVNSSTQGFRATGNIETSRVFILNQVNNDIEVAKGNTMILNSAFSLGAVSHGLTKNDGGKLVLTASNSNWTGAINVNNGALEVRGPNANILGSGAVTISALTGGALDGHHAVQLSGGVNVANALFINGNSGGFNSGINFGGALQSLSGTNVWSGAITLVTGGTGVIGVDSGTLNLTSATALSGSGFNLILTAGATGTGNIDSVIGIGAGSLSKYGAGTWNLTAANTLTGSVTVNAGTLALTGVNGSLPADGTAAINVQPGGTFLIDNTTNYKANRVGTGARAMNLNGGNLVIEGNGTTATNETIGTGTLTLGVGGSTITLDANGGPGVTLTIGSFGNPTVGRTALVRGTDLGTTTKLISSSAPTLYGGTGAAGTTTMGIRPDVIGDNNPMGAGAGFVTYVAGTGFRTLAPSEMASNLYAGSTTNVALSGSHALPIAATINSLTLNVGANLTISAPQTLTIGPSVAAGILALGANTISSGRIVTTSNAHLFVHTVGVLDFDATIVGGTGGLTKSLDGALNFNTEQYYTGTTTINDGTLRLEAGGNNTLYFNNTLTLNAGGTLDLNGGVQTVGSFSSQGAAPGAGVAGGAIISSSGGGAILVNTGSNSFSGTISGIGVGFARSGSGSLNLLGATTYTGETRLSGGDTLLADDGTLSGTSQISINNAVLRIDNSRASGNDDRVNDSAPIFMNSGTLNFYGRNGTLSTERIGVVNLQSGTSVLSAANHSFGTSNSPYSADLILSGLNRNTAAGATVNFAQNYNSNSSGTLGLIGSSHRIIVEGGIPTIHNIIGGHAVITNFFDSTAAEFASYSPATEGNLGVGPLNLSGFAGYDGTVLPASNQPTQNIRISSGSGTVTAGGVAVNSLNLASNTASNVTLDFVNSGDVLNLASGGLIIQNIASPAGSTQIGNLVGGGPVGRLTAGGIAPTSGTSDLYLYYMGRGGVLLTVNSQFTDNETAVLEADQRVRLVLWGGVFGNSNIVLTNGSNDYTGGTVINSANVRLDGVGYLPGGGVTVNNGTLLAGSNFGASGGIDDSNVVTLNNSVLTLTGNNNLNGLVLNHDGSSNARVNINSLLQLTGDIIATPTSVGTAITGTTALIDAGELRLNSGTQNIIVAQNLFSGVDAAPLLPGLTITSLITGTSSINKTGLGVLQLTNNGNTFSGGVLLSAGSLMIGGSGSASSVPTLGGPIVSGPLGTGALTLGDGTTLLAGGNGGGTYTLLNDLRVLGDDFSFNGPFNLQFTGAINLNQETVTITVVNPNMVATLAGKIATAGASPTIIKDGLGTLVLSDYTGSVTILNGPLSLFSDGDGTSMRQALPFGNVALSNAAATINVGRLGNGSTSGPLLFQTASNKTIVATGLSLSNDPDNNVLTLNNLNGYGFEVNGTVPITLRTNQIFNVLNATASNVVQGLTLSSQVTDGANSFGLVKVGNGTLELTNAANDFGGAGRTIDIQQGVLAASSDGALGAAGNMILLNPILGGTSTFRATGTGTLLMPLSGRQIQLTGTANTRAIEVVAGKTLQLDTPFDLNGGAGATASLAKNDNGVLILNGANTGWSGVLNINGGAVRLTNSSGAGTGTIFVAPTSNATGAALQLAGGVNVANTLVLQGVNNQLAGGINSGGQLENFSGANTYSGAITTAFDALIGSTAGTLNIAGGVQVNTANRQLWFAGAGDIVLSGTPLSATGGATGFFSIQKFGSGTLAITNANTVAISDNTGFRVNGGTVLFKDGGTWTGNFNTGTNYLINPGGTLTLDNTGTNINNRLGGTRLIQFVGGNFNLIGNASASTTETFASPNFARGNSVITVTAGANAQTNLLFTGSSNNPTPAQTSGASGATVLFRGTGLGAQTPANGVATIRDTGGTNGFAFSGQTGATGTTNKGIMPWALIDTTATGSGMSFATGDSTAGFPGTLTYIRPLDINTEMVTNTLSGGAVAAPNVRLTADALVAATVAASNVLINSLTLESGLTMTLGSDQALQLSSGGILAKAGNSVIAGGVINQTRTLSPLTIWTLGNLEITSALNGGNAQSSGNISLVKSGAGMLTLTSPESNVIAGMSANTIVGQTVINQGTLRLNGGTNTLFYNNYLELGLGGTLDLNGTSQYVLGLFSDGTVAGTGGTVTGGVGSNLVVNTDTRNFAGSIAGDVSFMRSGTTGSNLILFSDNDYTGVTRLTGGSTFVRDSGRLSQTSAIEINYANLTIDNQGGLSDLSDRINNNATIFMRGGVITMNGRSQTASSETLGAVQLLQGVSEINATAGGTGVNSAELRLANLTQGLSTSSTDATDATTNFQASGLIGSNRRIYITAFDNAGLGSAGTGDDYGMTNHLMGAWAVVGGNEFATYNPGTGVGTLSTAGYAGYDGATLPLTALNSATQNYRLTVTGTVAGDYLSNQIQSINSLTLSGATNLAFTNQTGLLNLTSGGLISTGGNKSIGDQGPGWGYITAGGDNPSLAAPLDLHLHANGSTTNIDAVIIDNPTNNHGVRLVISAYNGAVVNLRGRDFSTPGNQYTGGTVVNGWTPNSGTLVIPAMDPNVFPIFQNELYGGYLPAGGLTINGATVTQQAANGSNTKAGLIDSLNVVTLNGSSTLNLQSASTLAGLIFNTSGGSSSNPSVNALGTLTLTSNQIAVSANNAVASTIVSTPTSVSSTAQITGSLNLNPSSVIYVNPIMFNGKDVAPLQPGLNIGDILVGASGYTKDGGGVLGLTAQQSYTGATTVNGGGLRIGAANAGSQSSAYTLNDGTRLDLNGFSTTLGSVTGTGTVFNSMQTTANLSVGANNSSTTFSGLLTDSLGTQLSLTKVGNGTLTLSNTASDYRAGTFINGGTLVLGGLSNMDVVTGLGALTINQTGTLSGVGRIAGGLIGNAGGSFLLSAGATAPITSALIPTFNGLTTINLANASMSSGYYGLIDYDGPVALTAVQFGSLKLGTNPGGGFVYTLFNNTANTSIDLSVEAISANILTWTGGTNNVWNTTTPGNWSPINYADGYRVIFNDTGLNRNITGPTVAPQQITVDSSAAVGYVINNNIGGTVALGLTKQGTGSLKLTGNNTFTGGTALNGGRLEAVISATSSALGSSNITMANGTTLQFDATATMNSGLNGRAFSGPGGTAAAQNFSGTAADSSVYFNPTPATFNLSGGQGPNYASGPLQPLQNSFGIEWLGKIQITNGGAYSFFSNSDDGSRLFIDGVLVAQHEGGHGGTTTPGPGGTIFLSSGLHEIRVQLVQGSGGWQEIVSYAGGDTNGSVVQVPNSVLFRPEVESTTGSSNAIQLGNNVTVNGNTTIDLNGRNFTAMQFGTLTPVVESTLNVTGLSGKMLRATSTFIQGAGSVTFNAVADLALGTVNDSGNAVTMVKQGAGRLLLDNTSASTPNSLSANSVIEVQNGRLVVQGSNLAGSTNPLGLARVTLNGGILTLDSKGGGYTVNTGLTLNADSTIEVVPAAQTITLGSATNGIVLNNADLTVDSFGGSRGAGGFSGVSASGATLLINGVISGTGDLTLRSSQFSNGVNMLPVNGNLTLAAANTFVGSVAVQGEPVFVQGANGLTSGAFNTNGGQAVLTLNGAGSILNSTGTIQITNGQLTLDNGTNSNNRIANTQGVRLNQGIFQFNVNTGAVATTETVGTVTADSGFNQIRMNNAVTGQNTTLEMAALVRNNRSSLLFQGVNLGATATGASRLVFTTAPTGSLVGSGGVAGSKNISILPFAIGAANTGAPVLWSLVTLDINGIRPLAATEYNTLAAAGTTDNARDTFAGGTQALAGKVVNAYILDNNVSTGALTANLTGTLTLTSGALAFTNVTASSATANYQATALAGGTVDFGAAEGNIFVMTPAGVTISSTLTGTNGLTVSGNGQLTLSTANTGLGGAVTINGTTLNIASDGSLGTLAGANALAFGGGILRFGASGITLAATRAVTLFENSFGAFDTAANSATVAGNISGAGDLMKLGGNTLTLTGTNSYTGRTIISQGTLQAGLANLPNSASNVIVNNGVMSFVQTGGGTYNGSISGIGSVSVNVGAAGGTFAFAGTNTHGGGTNVVSASTNTTLQGNTNNLNGAINIANATSGVTFNQNFDATSTATVTGSGKFTKTGTAMLTLSNNSTYSGVTDVQQGTLAFSAATQLGNSAATNTVVILNNATLQLVDAPYATTPTSVDLGATRAIALGAGGGTINVGSFVDAYTAPIPDTLTISAAISGTAGNNLTKTGTGTLELASINTYAGVTEIDQGMLSVLVSGSISGSTVNVDSGATLRALGTVVGTVTNSGTVVGGSTDGSTGSIGILNAIANSIVSPGTTTDGLNSTAILNTGALSLGDNSQLKLEIGTSTVAGIGYDQIAASNAVSLLGNATLSLSLQNGYAPNFADQFVLIMNNSSQALNGTFSNYASSGSSIFATNNLGTFQFTINYDGNFAGDGMANDVYLMAVPEPNAAAMLAGSLGLALGLQRFRRRRTIKAGGI
jgi:autotransporter-associated beta strand protein